MPKIVGCWVDSRMFHGETRNWTQRIVFFHFLVISSYKMLQVLSNLWYLFTIFTNETYFFIHIALRAWAKQFNTQKKQRKKLLKIPLGCFQEVQNSPIRHGFMNNFISQQRRRIRQGLCGQMTNDKMQQLGWSVINVSSKWEYIWS